jgi:Sulfotransferase domain
MMRLLATSPQIALERQYPYESRYFTYFLEWCRVIERTDWDKELWRGNPTNALPQPHGLVGPMPWPDRLLIAGGNPYWQDCLSAIWRVFSSRAITNTRRDRGTQLPVRYYAEKYGRPWQIPRSVHAALSIRIIALLRDPRDTWASAIDFHRQRKEGFFPVRAGETREDIFRGFLERQRMRLRWLQRVREGDQIPIVRYERLIGDLSAEADRIGEWLDVSLNVDAVHDSIGVTTRQHMTAETPEQSIGRWRSDLPPDEVEAFRRELGGELAAFGFLAPGG